MEYFSRVVITRQNYMEMKQNQFSQKILWRVKIKVHKHTISVYEIVVQFIISYTYTKSSLWRSLFAILLSFYQTLNRVINLRLTWNPINVHFLSRSFDPKSNENHGCIFLGVVVVWPSAARRERDTGNEALGFTFFNPMASSELRGNNNIQQIILLQL